MCTGEEARKREIHPGFEPQNRRHQKSKRGISVASQKRLMSSQILFKKKQTYMSSQIFFKKKQTYI